MRNKVCLMLAVLSAFLMWTPIPGRTQDVSINGPLTFEEVFVIDGVSYTNTTIYYLIVGEQFPSNVCSLQESGVSDFSSLFTSASYGCYNVDQFVVGSFPDWLPHAYFRSLNTPCDPGFFAPAFFVEGDGPPEPVPAPWKGLRFKAVVLPSGRRAAVLAPDGTLCLAGLPATLPPRLDGVLRFTLCRTLSPLSD